jgi:methylglutamate dehydrogenase subunit B
VSPRSGDGEGVLAIWSDQRNAMLIACPYCGPRDVAEFTYQGDANRERPDPANVDQAAWNAYVYDRVNTAGDHREYWQHSGGCRAHLVLTRSTLTHRIATAAFAHDAQPAKGRPA